MKLNINEFLKNRLAHFLAILAFFAIISLYTIFSFWSSTNDYINNLYSSTVYVDGVPVGEESAEEPYEIFTDVTSDHINAEAIEALYHEGIIRGYGDGTFKPNDTITRAEFLVVVTNAVDADFGGMVLENCCGDVGEEWYSVFVCYAKRKDWIKGYSDGSCGPERAVTKAEAIKIAFEALEYLPCEVVGEAPYGDVELDAWYAGYACAAKMGRIIPQAGLFTPQRELTRAELVQIVYNLMLAKGML